MVSIKALKYDRHARRRMKWRNISKDEVQKAVNNPDKTELTEKGRINVFKTIGERGKGKRKMKIEYSKRADALYVYFRHAMVAKSKEIEEGVVIDFDAEGHIVGIEILDATQRMQSKELANVSIENLPVGLGV